MNNILTASELAKVLVDTIVSKYLETGLVVSDNYAASIQTKGPKANASVPPKVNTTKRTTRAQTSKPSEPNYGDFKVFVGESNDGSRVTRAKLPSAMFDGFDAIVIQLPNGQDVQVNRDAEGRGRLGKNELDAINCGPNCYLVFNEVSDGTFEVSIVGHDAEIGTYQSFGPVVEPKQARGYWGAMPSANQDVPKVKKPRSAAQLANDARLRDRAINRNGNAGRNTPNYVKVAPTAQQARIEQNRARNHATQYANNTAHRNQVSTLRNVAAPIVRRDR